MNLNCQSDSDQPVRGTFSALFAVVFLLVGFSTEFVSGQGRFDDLLVRLPASTNALMVVDVQAVSRSPLAVREGWLKQYESTYVNQPMILPPESDRLVLASQMNPNRGFAQAWEAAVISLTEPLSMRSIARAEGGYLDSIGGLKAAWTPSDAYFVSIDADTLGGMHPAHRQAVARWVKTSRSSRSVRLSPYLRKAAAAASRSTQIVLAMDLQGAVQPHSLQERLSDSEFTRDDPGKQQKWAAVIAGIQGLTLKMQLGTSALATLQVDFTDSTDVFGKDARAVVLGVLDRHGVGLAEMQSWTASLQGSSMRLTGTLSTPGMRQVFSLLELPTSKFSTVKAEDVSRSTSTDPGYIAQASKRYFASVSTLLDDLQKEFATNRDARRNMAPVVMERYGRRIGRLPILNVDEDLLAYGASVAESLGDVSVSSRMAGVRSGVRKSQLYGNYQYSYDGNGYYSERSTQSIQTQMQREEQARASQVRFQTFKEIEDATVQMRNAMTRKYKVQF